MVCTGTIYFTLALLCVLSSPSELKKLPVFELLSSSARSLNEGINKFHCMAVKSGGNGTL